MPIYTLVFANEKLKTMRRSKAMRSSKVTWNSSKIQLLWIQSQVKAARQVCLYCPVPQNSSTMESVPESIYQQTNQNSPQVSSLCNPNAQERKPFPSSIVTQDLVTFKPFPPTGSLGPGKLVLPFQNFTIGKPFVPSQDENNNPTVDTERSESNQTEYVKAKNSTRSFQVW